MDTKEITTMDFSEALRYAKDGIKISRLQFRENCYVMAQFPDENSKMTLPYLYMIKKVWRTEDVERAENPQVICFPFEPSNESLFATDWYVVEQ